MGSYSLGRKNPGRVKRKLPPYKNLQVEKQKNKMYNISVKRKKGNEKK